MGLGWSLSGFEVLCGAFRLNGPVTVRKSCRIEFAKQGVGGGWYLQVFSVVRSAAHRLVAESGCERLRSGVVGCDGPCLSS